MSEPDGLPERVRFERSDDFHQQLREKGIYLPVEMSFVRTECILEPPIELIGGINVGRPCRIGAFSYSWSHLTSAVESIGRYCSIAGEVTFGGLEHPTDRLSTSSFTYEREWMWKRFADGRGQVWDPEVLDEHKKVPPIRIGNDVWIGLGAYIRGGVTLGDGCIVGAKAVVTRDVPPYAVIVGNPARIRKYRFSDKIIARLLELQWWRYAFTDLPIPKNSDVHTQIEDIAAGISNNTIVSYDPPLTCLCGE